MLNDPDRYSITKGANRSIEMNQFPHFRNHTSLLGWSRMNFPTTLINPEYNTQPIPKSEANPIQNLYHIRSRANSAFNGSFKKPFTNLSNLNSSLIEEKLGNPPSGYKRSDLNVTTVSLDKREICYSNILPLHAELGGRRENNYERRQKLIGDVTYQMGYENQDIRHLKKLPSSIITEQNLMDILNVQLLHLNLHNHTWINNNLLNKIGYFAVNIQELIISGTEISDQGFVQLSISCPKLFYIDISKCFNLTEQGISIFLNNQPQLRTFFANHNESSVTDESLQPLQKNRNIRELGVSFCKQLTNKFFEMLSASQTFLTVLKISNLPLVGGKVLCPLINRSMKKLRIIDMSFTKSPEFNQDFFVQLGNCSQLQQIILTGCSQITDEDISNLTNGQDRQFQSSGLEMLHTLKVGGCTGVGDMSLSKLVISCPNIRLLEINNMDRVSQYTLREVAKHCQKIETVFLNLTPAITEPVLKEIQQTNPKINFSRIILKHTELQDDGLRMPFPNIHTKQKKQKKKKKK